MRKASWLVVGTLMLWLLLPAGGAWAGTTASGGKLYTVQPGDTLYRIAQRYGLSVGVLRQDNRLSGTLIRPGQKLWLRSTNNGSSYYRVQRGDSLYLIARRTGTTVAAIRQLNRLSGSLIYPGQILRLPSRNPAVASRAVQPTWTASDLYLLARLVHAEARGEPYIGQVAVAAVVLNRLKNPRFPNTIAGIIYQPGAFSAVADGQINLPPSATALRAARDALRGWDPSGGALYYWNPAKATNRWVWSRPIVARYGGHVFAL
ncbi:MAG: cell wall hydrolase [Moorellales bacterium]